MPEKRKLIFLSLLLCVLAGTVVYGIFHKHHFVTFVFSLWCFFEMALWGFQRTPVSMMAKFPKFGEVARLGYLVQLFGNTDGQSENLLEQTILELKLSGRLSEVELRFLARLSEMLELRTLSERHNLVGKRKLKQAFIYSLEIRPLGKLESEYALQDIAEAAVHVAGLYRRVFEESQKSNSPLRRAAQKLLTSLLGTQSPESLREKVDHLTDAMQRESGVPFLMLNVIRQGQFMWAKHFAQKLLTSEYELDEEVRCSLYWMGELSWFTQVSPSPVTDYESSIRYLYHLCFTSPDRAGFLEIDSQFFSQFETVTELAREGFLFKEALIERFLTLWGEQDRHFDDIFKGVMEAMTQQHSKIYDDRDSWEMFWHRESKDFAKDLLYMVEGNLAYCSGHLDDAKSYYEKALKVNPELRSAMLNLLFVAAKSKDRQALDVASQRVLQNDNLLPAALSVIGNAYLLAGYQKVSDSYYADLKRESGWSSKTEHYRSVFCHEHGLFEKALEYAREAVRQNPGDTSMRYHLSLCYSSLGEKDQALNAVRGLSEVPQWVDYYRFTLERDAGHHQEASQTLMKIPSEYFQDPEELEEALEFARARKDLVLLRHLRSRG